MTAIRFLNKHRPDVLRLLIEEAEAQGDTNWVLEDSSVNSSIRWARTRQGGGCWADLNDDNFNYRLIDEWISEENWKPKNPVLYKGRRLLLTDDNLPPIGTHLYPGPDFEEFYSKASLKFPLIVSEHFDDGFIADNNGITFEVFPSSFNTDDETLFMFTYETVNTTSPVPPTPPNLTTPPTPSRPHPLDTLSEEDIQDLIKILATPDESGRVIEAWNTTLAVTYYTVNSKEELERARNLLKQIGVIDSTDSEYYEYFKPGYIFFFGNGFDIDRYFEFWFNPGQEVQSHWKTFSQIEINIKLFLNRIKHHNDGQQQQQQQQQESGCRSSATTTATSDLPPETPTVICGKVIRGSAVPSGGDQVTIAIGSSRIAKAVICKA